MCQVARLKDALAEIEAMAPKNSSIEGCARKALELPAKAQETK